MGVWRKEGLETEGLIKKVWRREGWIERGFGKKRVWQKEGLAKRGFDRKRD